MSAKMQDAYQEIKSEETGFNDPHQIEWQTNKPITLKYSNIKSAIVKVEPLNNDSNHSNSLSILTKPKKKILRKVCEVLQLDSNLPLSTMKEELKQRTKQVACNTPDLSSPKATTCTSVYITQLPKYFKSFHMRTLIQLKSDFDVYSESYYIDMLDDANNRHTGKCLLRFIENKDCIQVFKDLQGIEIIGEGPILVNLDLGDEIANERDRCNPNFEVNLRKFNEARARYMKTFELEKKSIPDGVTTYKEETHGENEDFEDSSVNREYTFPTDIFSVKTEILNYSIEIENNDDILDIKQETANDAELDTSDSTIVLAPTELNNDSTEDVTKGSTQDIPTDMNGQNNENANTTDESAVDTNPNVVLAPTKSKYDFIEDVKEETARLIATNMNLQNNEDVNITYEAAVDDYQYVDDYDYIDDYRRDENVTQDSRTQNESSEFSLEHDTSADFKKCKIVHLENIPRNYSFRCMSVIKALLREKFCNDMIQYTPVIDENNKVTTDVLIQLTTHENAVAAAELLNGVMILGEKLEARMGVGYCFKKKISTTDVKKIKRKRRFLFDEDRENEAPAKRPRVEDSSTKKTVNYDFGFLPPEINYNDYFGLNKDFMKIIGINLPPTRRLIVSNLHPEVNEAKLLEVFSLAGEVWNVKIFTDVKGGKQAKIEYDHPLEAVQAISMLHKHNLYNMALDVRMDFSRKEQPLPLGLASVGQGLGFNGETLRGLRIIAELKNINESLTELGVMKKVLKTKPATSTCKWKRKITPFKFDYVKRKQKTFGGKPKTDKNSNNSKAPINSYPPQNQNFAGPDLQNLQNMIGVTVPQNTVPMSKNTAPLSQNTAPLLQNTASLSLNTAPLSQNTAPIHHNTMPAALPSIGYIGTAKDPLNMAINKVLELMTPNTVTLNMVQSNMAQHIQGSLTSLPDALVKQTSWSLPPQTAQLLPPQTAQILPPQTAQLLPPQTAQLLAPQTAQLLAPQTAQLLPPQTAQILPPQTAQLLPPQTAQLLAPQTAQLLPPSTAQQTKLELVSETESSKDKDSPQRKCQMKKDKKMEREKTRQDSPCRRSPVGKYSRHRKSLERDICQRRDSVEKDPRERTTSMERDSGRRRSSIERLRNSSVERDSLEMKTSMEKNSGHRRSSVERLGKSSVKRDSLEMKSSTEKESGRRRSSVDHLRRSSVERDSRERRSSVDKNRRSVKKKTCRRRERLKKKQLQRCNSEEKDSLQSRCTDEEYSRDTRLSEERDYLRRRGSRERYGKRRDSIDDEPRYSRPSRYSEERQRDSRERERDYRNYMSPMLVFKNLPSSVSLECLSKKIDELGSVEVCEMVGGGRAFIRFQQPRLAERCIELFHLAKVDGQVIEVDYL